MPATETGGAKTGGRRKRYRPKPRSTAPVQSGDARDRAAAAPVPPNSSTATAPFRPIRSQAAPFAPQRKQAAAKTRQATGRLGDPRYASKPEPLPPVYKIDPKRVALPPAFRPIDSQARPLRVQQSQQAHKTRAARAQLPDHPGIPEVDGLYLEKHLAQLDAVYKRARLKAANGDVKGAQADYDRALRRLKAKTPEQLIGQIRDAYKAAARKLGGSSINDLYQYGSLRQRRQMKRVGRIVGAIEGHNADRIAELRGIPLGQDQVKPTQTRTAIAGIPVGELVHAGGRLLDESTRIPGHTNASLADLGNIGPQLAIATAQHPSQVFRSSLRTAIESVTSIPMGVKAIVSDPKALGKIAQDYEHRYGPIFDDPAEFRRRVAEESGLTPFVFDAATLGVPVGRAATLIARTGAYGRAVTALAHVAAGNGKLRPLADFAETTHKLARAPRDARRLAGLNDRLHLATLEGDVHEQARLRSAIRDAEANVKATERPALRFSGGEGGVRKQATSPNLITALGQKGLDTVRAGASTKAAARAGLDVGPGGRLITVRGRQVVRMAAMRPGDREVVPKTTGVLGRSARELPGLRRYTGRVARDLGGQQSISRIRLLTHRGRILNQIGKALDRLNPDEQASMKYMLQLGATPDQAGIRLLERRRTDILANRAGKNTKRVAPLLENTNDELKLIDRILTDPTRHLTTKAREVADELRSIQLAEAKRDPELTGAQELIRRVTPQGKAIGVTRGPDAEFFRGVLQDLGREKIGPKGTVVRPAVPGLATHADALATMMPDARGAAAGDLVKGMRKQRKKAERNVATAERRLARAQEHVRTAEARGVPYDTVEVVDARRALARAKLARRTIGRGLTRAERRAGRAQGRLGEREAHGAPLVTPEVRAARAAVSAVDRHLQSLRGQLTVAEEKASRLQGRTEGRYAAGKMNTSAGRVAADQADVVAELKLVVADAEKAAADARAHLKLTERGAPRITPEQFSQRVAAAGLPDELAKQLETADTAVGTARQVLNQALDVAPRVTPTQAAKVGIRERELAASKTTLEHVHNFEKALKRVQRAANSKKTMRLEDAVTFAERVKTAAEAEGLAAPAYWWSSLAPKEMPSLAAAGKGMRAAHANKPYKGTLFDIGAEEHGIDVFTRGVERNIKRRFQQQLVARNLETHAYEWSRGAHGGGLTIAELEKHMIDHAIDPKSVELVEPRILRRRPTEEAGIERGRAYSDEEINAMDPATFISTTQQDLAEGRRRIEEVRSWDLKKQAQHRFLVVPREVGETLDGVAARMDNTFWRGMEIVLKQKPARILLGAANVPWLAFQIASNGLLTGLGGGVNPFNVYGAHKWWRGLNADQKEAIEAELGISHGHHFGMDQPHLGATTSRMVNTWRAFKTTRVMRAGHQVNPLNLMFRADEAQNNFFRRVLFYDKSRKAAYRRMGHSWRGIDTATTRLVDRVLARPPLEQANLIARHGAEFEKVAKHVNDFLGDYLRFTPAERFLLQRNVMFYGYLRYSLRFTFYTMPIGHPIMANILGNVSRMGAQEIKDLMGVPNNYSLPTSILTQTYFGDRADAKKNTLRSLPLGRFNPFLNALTQLDGLQQAVGLVSPFYQIIADQAFEESSFTGRDWRIGGRPTPSESDRPRNYFGHTLGMLRPGSPRNRIAVAELLNLVYPYRVATKTGIPGIVDPLAPNQSDDALLGSPRPMRYADPGAQKGVNQSRRAFENQGAGRRLAGAVLPVFPQRTSSPAVVARELEREAAIRARNARKPGARKKRRRKGTANRYGTGGGSSSGGRYR